MNRTKYFKVIERVSAEGRKVFVVKGCNSFIEFLIGPWHEFTKENNSLKGAITQIENIAKDRIKVEKVVWRVNND